MARGLEQFLKPRNRKADFPYVKGYLKDRDKKQKFEEICRKRSISVSTAIERFVDGVIKQDEEQQLTNIKGSTKRR